MLMIIFFTCVLHAVVCIIVTDAPPSSDVYKYSYIIVDPTTGDTKSLHEVKHGDTVSGSYSVVDPDGTKRTVEYTADAKTGFRAVVRNEPLEDHSNEIHGIPYSSLYHSQNFDIKLNKKRKFTPRQYSERNAKTIALFRPGRGPPTEEKFCQENSSNLITATNNITIANIFI